MEQEETKQSLLYVINGVRYEFTDPAEIKSLQPYQRRIREARELEQSMDPFEVMGLEESPEDIAHAELVAAMDDIIESRKNQMKSDVSDVGVSNETETTASSAAEEPHADQEQSAEHQADAQGPDASASVEQEVPQGDDVTATPAIQDPQAQVSVAVETCGEPETLAVNGTGNQVMPKTDDTIAIQQALANAGYDIGHFADGTPMVDGLEGPLTRAAVEEYAQDQGLDLNEITAGELVAAIENTVQTQQIAQQMDMGGADVTIAGDPGFIQENAASIGVPMPEPQQPAPGISPQQPQMGAPGQMA